MHNTMHSDSSTRRRHMGYPSAASSTGSPTRKINDSAVPVIASMQVDILPSLGISFLFYPLGPDTDTGSQDMCIGRSSAARPSRQSGIASDTGTDASHSGTYEHQDNPFAARISDVIHDLAHIRSESIEGRWINPRAFTLALGTTTKRMASARLRVSFFRWTISFDDDLISDRFLHLVSTRPIAASFFSLHIYHYSS